MSLFVSRLLVTHPNATDPAKAAPTDMLLAPPYIFSLTPVRISSQFIG